MHRRLQNVDGEIAHKNMVEGEVRSFASSKCLRAEPNQDWAFLYV